MRQDMYKVIVERPRAKSRWITKVKNRVGEEKKRGIRDSAWDAESFDEPCNFEKIRPVGPGADRKSLNENLEPLRRFLEKNIGRPWNDVYSEIREHLDSKSAVKMHVIEHLDGWVCKNTYIANDGRVWELGGYRNAQSLEDFSYYPRYYVHPETHFLCSSPCGGKPWHQNKHTNQTVFNLDNFHQFRLIEGVWYVLTLETIPTELGKKNGSNWGSKYIQAGMFPPSFDGIPDLLFPNGARTWERERALGFCNLWVVEKRELGRRELKLLASLLSSKKKEESP